MRTAAAVLLTLGIGVAIAACGDSGSGDPAPADVTLKVRFEGSPEELILGQIYAQALKAAGFKVEKARRPSFGAATGIDAVKFGQTSGYLDHLNSALYGDLGVSVSEMPGDTEAAYKMAKEGFEKQGFTAFPPTPFALANAVGMLRKKAERLGLETDSDLKGKSENLTLRGARSCHVSLECLGGLEQYYRLGFGGFAAIDPDLRYEVLEDGEADSSMLTTTEGRLAAERDRFVVLEDDRHLLPAGNAIWVTTPEVVEEAGPEYEEAIVDVQKGLTLPVMQKLNAQMELGKRSAAAVAAGYLDSIDYE